jgi:hypothetical protein
MTRRTKKTTRPTKKTPRRRRFRETGGHGDSYYVRQQLSLSPRDLADILGCSHVTVYRWESAKNIKPEGLYDIVLHGIAEHLRGFRDDEVRRTVAYQWFNDLMNVLNYECTRFERFMCLVTAPQPPGGGTWEAFTDELNDPHGDRRYKPRSDR